MPHALPRYGQRCRRRPGDVAKDLVHWRPCGESDGAIASVFRRDQACRGSSRQRSKRRLDAVPRKRGMVRPDRDRGRRSRIERAAEGRQQSRSQISRGLGFSPPWRSEQRNESGILGIRLRLQHRLPESMRAVGARSVFEEGSIEPQRSGRGQRRDQTCFDRPFDGSTREKEENGECAGHAAIIDQTRSSVSLDCSGVRSAKDSGLAARSPSSPAGARKRRSSSDSRT